MVEAGGVDETDAWGTVELAAAVANPRVASVVEPDATAVERTEPAVVVCVGFEATTAPPAIDDVVDEPLAP